MLSGHLWLQGWRFCALQRWTAPSKTEVPLEITAGSPFVGHVEAHCPQGFTVSPSLLTATRRSWSERTERERFSKLSSAKTASFSEISSCPIDFKHPVCFHDFHAVCWQQCPFKAGPCGCGPCIIELSCFLSFWGCGLLSKVPGSVVSTWVLCWLLIVSVLLRPA